MEAVYKLSAVPVELIGRTAIPPMDMRVDYEDLITISCTKHFSKPQPVLEYRYCLAQAR
jgi:hypothetical protein